MLYNRLGGTTKSYIGISSIQIYYLLLRDEIEKEKENPIHRDLFLRKTEIKMVTVNIK